MGGHSHGFCFLYSGEQHQQTRTQKKKFASLSKAAGFLRAIEGFDFNLVRLVALARAKFRKQKSKIRSHKEKQNHKSKHGTHKADEKHKPTYPKAACTPEEKSIKV